MELHRSPTSALIKRLLRLHHWRGASPAHAVACVVWIVTVLVGDRGYFGWLRRTEDAVLVAQRAQLVRTAAEGRSRLCGNGGGQ